MGKARSPWLDGSSARRMITIGALSGPDQCAEVLVPVVLRPLDGGSAEPGVLDLKVRPRGEQNADKFCVSAFRRAV